MQLFYHNYKIRKGYDSTTFFSLNICSNKNGSLTSLKLHWNVALSCRTFSRLQVFYLGTFQKNSFYLIKNQFGVSDWSVRDLDWWENQTLLQKI